MGTPTDYSVIVNSGLAEFGALASATTPATAATVITLNHMTREILVASTLDRDVWLTLKFPGDTVGADWIPLMAGGGAGTSPYKVVIPAGAIIGAYSMTTAPTSGWIGICAN